MKNFLIGLIIILLVSIALVEAKVEFGNWDKWDKEFPSNKYWASASFTRELYLIDSKEKEIVFWATNIFFCNNKKCNEKMAVILLSPANKKPDMKNILIGSDYQLAISAFPPKKDIVKIVAYKKNESSGKLKFYEEWEIPYKKNHPIIIQNAEFTKVFQGWLEEQSLGRIDRVVFHLVIFDQKNFIILMDKELEEKDKIDMLEKFLKSF